jgi:hypothetical protein
MAGFRHLEGEFHTAKEMEESKKAVRRFGFVEIDHVLPHVTRLMALNNLHLKMKQVSRYSIRVKARRTCLLTE